MNQQIETLVIDALKELNEELKNENLYEPTIETKIYGEYGTLDSLALVSLITDLEERISYEFNRDIVLADERAVSQRRSPFNNVGSLSKYIAKLLQEAE